VTHAGKCPIGVAVHEAAVQLLERALADRPRLAIRPVLVDSAGQLDPGAAAGTMVLWRPIMTSPEWLLTAVERLPDLAWIHSDPVGVEALPLREFATRGLTLTNGAGIYSRPMAEWIVLSLLATVKRFPDFVRGSDRARWSPGAELHELAGRAVLLLGLGSVNTLVAQMLEPFDADVSAVTRRPRLAAPPGVRRLVGPDAWRNELPKADFVVLGLPVTDETRGMIDELALRQMKAGAWLVNIARGALVDETALIAALDDGRLGGALLDAFIEEPLPASHPLWRRSNVIVVPHHTWSSDAVSERRVALFRQQLDAWINGEPLKNTVDPVAGY